MAFDDLYQEIILDHYRNPRNSTDLSFISDENVHENPSCGDSVKIHAVVKDGKVEKLEFDGKGCAISVASASMMTEALKGKSVDECREIFTAFHALLTGERDVEETAPLLGKLQVFSGVREFPIRVKCATLAWHTLRAALEDEGRRESVTTE